MPNKVNVVVKLRPRSEREVASNLKEQWTVVGNSIRCCTKSFKFDHIFSTSSKNYDVFIGVVKPMVESCKNGFDTTVFTYGEKASGKTYTMDGTDDDPGLKMLAVDHLFKANQSGINLCRQFIIRVGYVEIYNEMIYDLLNRRQSVHFDLDSNMSNTEVIVKDQATLLTLLQKGNKAKTPKTGCQRSTSHTVFQIIIESRNEENKSFQVGHLNFVDLDRSEGAQVKDENGNCVDKSMECFVQAIGALGKDEMLRQCSKSNLTRMIKTTFSGKANIAIICNVNPTALSQTTNTLYFAEAAQEAKIWPKCNIVQSNDTIMKKVRDELAKIVTQHPKVAAELAELESIVLGNDMQPKHYSAVNRTGMEFLKVRPFPFHISSGDKKYQIGGMDGKGIDLQSRAQRKSMAFEWSDYYLERVGFEINSSMRHKLKYGKNLVGRCDVNDGIDIYIDSLKCSRKHCTITVADDESISLYDHSSNGTTVNGVISKGTTVNIREGDVIAIVPEPNKPLSFFIGNLNCTVYRLRKFSTEIMQTYDLDDCDDRNDVIVLSDDETNYDVTPRIPLKDVVNLPPPSVSIETQTSTKESVVTTVEPMLIETDKTDQSIEDDLLLDGIVDIQNCSEIVNDSAPFYDLGDIVGAYISEVDNVDNLGNLGRELDTLASVEMENVKLLQQLEQLNCDYEKVKKVLAEERQMVDLKLVAMAEEHSKLTTKTKWLELRLTALTEKVSALQAENSKLREIIELQHDA